MRSTKAHSPCGSATCGRYEPGSGARRSSLAEDEAQVLGQVPDTDGHEDCAQHDLERAFGADKRPRQLRATDLAHEAERKQRQSEPDPEGKEEEEPAQRVADREAEGEDANEEWTAARNRDR